MNFNFELILFYAILVSGVIVLADKLYFAARRKPVFDQQGEIKYPWLIDYARSFFPILIIVFLLRSFLFEPFRIPSGSLEPTLLPGDFILVNKFNYGIRLPVIHTKLFDRSEPKRGDIMVFRWPVDPSIDFIKRVVGLPGDKISYINKSLYVNGKKIDQINEQSVQVKNENDDTRQVLLKEENLLGIKHQIYTDPNKYSDDFYDIEVPKGEYFVMGDNRDDSADSRFWGFVPEKNIIGKAVLVWMSWNGNLTKIRWQRIGKMVH